MHMHTPHYSYNKYIKKVDGILCAFFSLPPLIHTYVASIYTMQNNIYLFLFFSFCLSSLFKLFLYILFLMRDSSFDDEIVRVCSSCCV